MLVVHCPRHDSRVMLPLEAVEAVTRDSAGLRVSFSCTCGHRGEWHARRTPPPPA